MKQGKIIKALAIFTILTINGVSSAEAGIDWSGSFEAQETYLAATAQNYQDTYILDGSLNVKTAINNGELQSGLVWLKFRFQSPGQDQHDWFNVYQAYWDLFFYENSLLRVGRQKISWGSGFAWNPTNYLGAPKNRSDLAAENPGVDAINYEIYQGGFSWTIAVTPQSTGEWGRAAKVSRRIGDGDFSFSLFQQGNKNAFGIDYATSLGNLTVYSELASKTGSEWYISGDYNKKNRSGSERYWHGVIGANGNFEDNWMILLEYYYNQEGWDDQEAGRYAPYLASLAPREGESLNQEKGGLFGELRRNYLNAMIRKGEAVEGMALSVGCLFNLDEGSYQLTPRLEYQFSENILLEGMLYYYYGSKLSEFGSLGNMAGLKITVSF